MNHLTATGRRSGRATMRDVAALAGVSLKTVSRVVNEEPGVSDDVRERVGVAVQSLEYSPNLAASNLRRSGARSGLIGALVQDLSNPFSAGVLRALEDAVRDHRTAVLAASLDEAPEREEALVHDLVSRRVDALVLMPASERQDYLVAELRAGTPAVFVDRPPRGVEADSVTVDNALGARAAVEHLVDHGHRRIAGLFHLGRITTAADRLAGFRQAHEARGLPLDPDLVVSDVAGDEEATKAVLALLDHDDPPTAFFAGRNVLTAGTVRALRDRGVQHSVAVVGFDDFLLADLVDPPLTVVRQDVERIGREVAGIVLARVKGDAAPERHVVIEPTLVPRGSGEVRGPA